MKIGFLNPWRDAAENQLIPILSQAAQMLGHTAVECKNSEDVLHHRPDLVVSLSRTQPKLTDIPTYGVLFDPRTILLSQQSYLSNIFTYDGVLTLFDSLETFVGDLSAACRRRIPTGRFFPTCMRVAWDDEIDFAAARLAYFGVNWDRRRNDLFALLDRQPWMDVYGPEPGWRFLNGSSYKGSVPFDGVSVLQRYHRAGAALCLFSDAHVADDIVTSRVFEAAAAGAILVAPRMPWLEKNLGDAVLYFDKDDTDERVAEQIGRHMAWIQAHPERARDLANRTRTLFETRFSLDILLPRVLEHHARVQAEKRAYTSEHRVSVIVRCDDGAPELLRRSLESVARQIHAATDVVVAFESQESEGRCRDVLAACRRAYGRPLTTVQRSRDPDGDALPGLDACSGDFIAVMPSGDEWLDDHLSSIMASLRAFGQRRLGYSGCIVRRARPFTMEGRGKEVRELLPFPFSYGSEDLVRESRTVPISSVVFHRSLLDDWMLIDPRMPTDDGALLVLSLLEKETPAFTYRATCVRYEQPRGPTQPYDEVASRDDVMRSYLRFVGRALPPLPRLVTFDALQRAARRAGGSRRSDAELTRRADGTVDYAPPPFPESIGPEERWQTVPLEIAPGDFELGGESTQASPASPFPLVIQPPTEPWADGLYWPLRLSQRGRCILRLTCRVERGTVAFGVVARGRSGVDDRVVVPSQSDRIVVSLPIPRPEQVGGIVVQATADPTPARVVIEAAELLAGEARLPDVVGRRLLEENERLRAQLDDATRDRELLEQGMTRSQRRIREMRSSRIWRLAGFYWRASARLEGLAGDRLWRRRRPPPE